MRKHMEMCVNNLIKRSKSVFLIVFCLLVTGCSQSLYKYSAPAEAQHYPVLKYKLIGLIEAFKKDIPTTLERSQAFFYNQLHITNETKFASFYSGGPFITRDGVVIQKVEMIVSKSDKTPVKEFILTFDQKQCVSTELLKKKFNVGTFFLRTLHPEADPPIGYTGRFNWGSLGVGTTLYNKNCATGVGVGALEN